MAGDAVGDGVSITTVMGLMVAARGKNEATRFDV